MCHYKIPGFMREGMRRFMELGFLLAEHEGEHPHFENDFFHARTSAAIAWCTGLRQGESKSWVYVVSEVPSACSFLLPFFWGRVNRLQNIGCQLILTFLLEDLETVSGIKPNASRPDRRRPTLTVPWRICVFNSYAATGRLATPTPCFIILTVVEGQGQEKYASRFQHVVTVTLWSPGGFLGAVFRVAG